MSEFEYVSVGLALVYSFTVARLVASFPALLAPNRRYWVSGLWALVLLLAAISTWWTIWDLREVEWNPLRFMWALSMPALIYLRVGILLSDSPGDVKSWRARFYQSRLQFFGVAILVVCNFAALPWIMGIPSWYASSPRLLALIALLVISVLGLVSSNPGLHGVLAVANFLMIIISMTAASF